MSKPSVFVGDKFVSKNGQVCEVIEYINSGKVFARFENGYVGPYSVGNLRKGEFSNPLFPNVCGIGYLGIGEFKISERGKKSYAYKKWNHMIERCYGSTQERYAPTYAGCSVDPIWHNFQNFAAWIKTQKGYGKSGWHLDKDIICPGNKVYGPEKCNLVPAVVNTFFSKPTKDNDLPVGVNRSLNKYTAEARFLNKSTYLGTFSTPDDAHSAFLQFKKSSTVKLIELFKEDLEPEILEALTFYAKEGFPYEKL